MRSLLNWNVVAVLLALVIALLTSEVPSAKAEGEPAPRRWYLTAMGGQSLTAAILGTSTGGTIRATWGSPELGYGLGMEQDFDSHLAVNLRAYYLDRSVHYDVENAVSDTLAVTFVHAPVQIRFIPKRWLHLGTGAYLDYCVRGGFPNDYGWTLAAGIDLPLSGKSKRKWGLIFDVNFNMSFLTYDNVSSRQLYAVLGFRFGGNSTPVFE